LQQLYYYSAVGVVTLAPFGEFDERLDKVRAKFKELIFIFCIFMDEMYDPEISWFR
jgi:hypothetical protein